MKSNSPQFGFTAVAAWIFSCILFVFVALVCYTVMLFQMKHDMKVIVQKIIYAHYYAQYYSSNFCIGIRCLFFDNFNSLSQPTKKLLEKEN